jgi:hypothetical protein
MHTNDSKPRKLKSKVGIAGEGPPPPGRVSLDSVPKSLRKYDKGLRVRTVFFDFSVMTRTLELAEVAEGTHLVSGFDPRHERHQGYAVDAGPRHGAKAWIGSLNPGDLAGALQAYGLSADGSKETLQTEIQRLNKKWIDGLLAREMRQELEKMALESHGKAWHLTSRLESALWEGDGTSPDFGRWSMPGGRTSIAEANETAAALGKGLNMNLDIKAVPGGGFDVQHRSQQAGASLEDEGSLADIIAGHADTGTSNRKPDSVPIKKVFRDSTPKGLPEQLTDVSTKYQALLQKRTGGMVTSRKLDNQQSSGDAEALSFGRKHLVESQAAAKSAGSQWLLGTGVGGLLEYLERRSLSMTLLPTDPNQDPADMESFLSQCPAAVTLKVVAPTVVAEHLYSANASDSATAATAATAAARDRDEPSSVGFGGFLRAVLLSGRGGGSGSSATSPVAASPSVRTEGWLRCLKALAVQENTEFGQLVVVSDNNDLLRAAREVSCHTIAFNPPNERGVDVSTDAQVSAISDVKDVVEQMNGISYRM